MENKSEKKIKIIMIIMIIIKKGGVRRIENKGLRTVWHAK